MSRENVEASRRVHQAFNRTFADGTSDLYEVLDPEVEWIPMIAILDGTHYHGHEGVRRWLADMKREWELFETRPVEFRDLGDDRVLSLGTWGARGRGSGVELENQQAAWLVSFRDGKLIQLQTFTDRLKALEAAGLR